MKLAEALNLRADIQKRIEQTSNRLLLNAKVQAGEKPAEDPKGLLTELNSLLTQLESLIWKINKKNTETVDKKTTLTELLAKRDCLSQKVQIMRNFLDAASSTTTRSTRSEIIIKSTVSVSTMRKEVDKLSKELRELDMRIQGINWITDIDI